MFKYSPQDPKYAALATQLSGSIEPLAHTKTFVQTENTSLFQELNQCYSDYSTIRSGETAPCYVAARKNLNFQRKSSYLIGSTYDQRFGVSERMFKNSLPLVGFTAENFLNEHISLNYEDRKQTYRLKAGIYHADFNSGSSRIPAADFLNHMAVGDLSTHYAQNQGIQRLYREFEGNYYTGMKEPILDPTNGKGLELGYITLKFTPSKKPKMLLPPVISMTDWEAFPELMVAEQWNIQVSRKKDFSVLDTVISGVIYKKYKMPQDLQAIENDLYSQLGATFEWTQTGKYYWRVAWSNITINLDSDARPYIRDLLDKKAELDGIGVELVLESERFNKRNYYLYSNIDSFVMIPPSGDYLTTPMDYEIIYPLDEDTLPFFNPPVLFKYQPRSNDHLMLVSSFDEPMQISKFNKIYIQDPSHPFIPIVKKMDDFDALVRGFFETETDLAIIGVQPGDGGVQDQITEIRGNLIENTFLIPLTIHDDQFEILQLNHIGRYCDIISHKVVDGLNNRFAAGMSTHFNERILKRSDYLNSSDGIIEHKWNTQIGTYALKGNPFVRIDEYLLGFETGQFNETHRASNLVKNGIKKETGVYYTGMKNATLFRYDGIILNPGDIELKFIPSKRPQKLLPTESELSENWKEGVELKAAHQLNIEISSNSNFHEGAIVEHIKLPFLLRITDPKEAEQVMNTLYPGELIKTMKFQEPEKYYWRVYWSNVNCVEDQEIKKFFNYNHEEPYRTLHKKDGPLYKYNINKVEIDSFVISGDAAGVPVYRVEYPLEDDTIPFMYPPVVISYSPTHPDNKLLLSSFSGNTDLWRQNLISVQKEDLALRNVQTGLNSNNVHRSTRDLMQEFLQSGNISSADQGLQLMLANKEYEALDFRKNSAQSILLGNASVIKRGVSKRMMDFNDFSSPPDMRFYTDQALAKTLFVTPNKNNVEWTASLYMFRENQADNNAYNSLTNQFLRTEPLSKYLNGTLMNTLKPVELKGKYAVGMKPAVLTNKYNGANVKPGDIELKFIPSQRPKKLFPPDLTPEIWADYPEFHVEQQYTIQISEYPNFAYCWEYPFRISKSYQFPGDKSQLEQDFYTEKILKFNTTKPGKWYYRVVWGNIGPLDNDLTHQNYIDELSLKLDGASMLNYLFSENGFSLYRGTEELVKMDPSKVSDFIQNRYYYGSHDVDSFVVVYDDLSVEVVYPLEGDTLPFHYVPIVLHSRSDDKTEALVAKINSDTDPVTSYHIITNNPDKSNSLSLQMKHTNLLNIWKRESTDPYGVDMHAEPGADEGFNGLVSAGLETYQNVTLGLETDLVIPTGYPLSTKTIVSGVLWDRSGKHRPYNASIFNRPHIQKMAIPYPHKGNVNWAVNVYGLPKNEFNPDLVNSILNNTLTTDFPQSKTVQKNSRALSGSYTMGMKKPVLNRLDGQSFMSGEVRLTFKPSGMPKRLYPPIEREDPKWTEYKATSVAQQYNVEVSTNPEFTQIVFAKSNRIVGHYHPGIYGQLEEAMYHEVNLNLPSIVQSGKYYYRVTWSNVTAPEGLPESERNNLQALGAQLSTHPELQDKFRVTPPEDLFFKRVDYLSSDLDSFVVVNESDKPPCGSDCIFNLTSINKTKVRHTLSKGSVLTIGKFELTIDQIAFNSEDKASGKGHVPVPYFNAPIAVEFSNVEINSELRIVSGTVNGLRDDASFFAQNPTFQDVRTNLWQAIYNEIKSKSPNDNGLKEMGRALNENLNLVSAVFSNTPVGLPIGISTVVGAQRYTLSVTDIQFNPDQAKVDLMAVFPLPYDLSVIGFGLQGLCITPEGFAGIENGGTLKCIKDVEVPFGDMKVTFKGKSDTSARACSVKWDCNGFQGLVVEADLSIPNSVLKRVQNGQILENVPVVFALSAEMRTFEDFIFSVDASGSFEFPQLPGYTLTFENATFDWSANANADNFTFPNGYNFQGPPNTWRGFYAREIGVRIPKEIGGREEGSRFSLSAHHVLIDQNGFTGIFAAQNIFTLDSGNLAGWKSSLDSFSLSVVQNTFRSGRLAGKFQVPGLDRPMPYFTTLTLPQDGKWSYGFGVRPEGNYLISFLSADVNLSPSSTVGLFYKNDQYNIEAKFNGDIGFGNGRLGEIDNVHFGRLPFEGLTISSAIGSNLDIRLEKLGGVDLMAAPSENGAKPANNSVNPLPKFGGFPLTIESFKWDTPKRILFPTPEGDNNDAKFGIKMKIVLNLSSFTPSAQEGTDPSGYGIAGRAGVGIYGIARLDPSAGFQVHFAGVDVDTIEFKAKMSGLVDFDGKIAMFNNDEVYGNGFSGFIKINFVMGFNVSSVAMLGDVNDFRYWMFDCKVEFPPLPLDFGLLAGASPLYAIGVNGGAWHHMRRTQGAAIAGAGLGRSNSGGIFTPDRETAFGLELGITLTGAPGTAMYGDVNLRGEFNSSDGSIKTLGLGGSIWNLEQNKKKAPIFLNGNIAINLNESRFSATLDAYVNIVNTIKGVGHVNIDQNRYYKAGSCIFDVDVAAKRWFLHAGNPTDPMGVNLTVPNLRDGLKISNYLMVGNTNFIQPNYPESVLTVFKENHKDIPIAERVINDDFAMYMGGLFTLPSFDNNLGPFYFHVRGDVGFDGRLSQEVPICGKKSEGIAGWYLNTTGYMAIHAGCGIDVKSPFYTGKVAFASVRAAGVVRAGFANPVQISGSFSTNYSVLGGLIYGVFNGEFSYSEPADCRPPGERGVFAAGRLIERVSPRNADSAVSIGIRPTIFLSYPIDRPFELEIPRRGREDSIDVRRFELKYEQLKFLRTKALTWVPVSHKVILSSDSLGMEIVPDSFLTPRNSQHRLEVKLVMYELTKNGRIRMADTSLRIIFTTENAPGTIPRDAIAYSQPVVGQNYYIHNPAGRIVFKSNPASFFEKGIVRSADLRPRGDKYRYFMELFDLNNRSITPISFTLVGNELRYTMPPILPQRIYMLRIIREELEYKNELDPGSMLERSETRRDMSPERTIVFQGREYSAGGNGEFTTLKPRARSLEENVDRTIIIFSYTFKTSRYSKAEDKMKQVRLKESAIPFELGKSVQLTLESDEAFDFADVLPISAGSNQEIFPPLFHFNMAPQTASNWHLTEYRNKIHVPDSILMRLLSPTPVLPLYADSEIQKRRLSVWSDGHIQGPMKQIPANYDYRLITRIAPTLAQQMAQSIQIVEPAFSAQFNREQSISFNAFGQTFSGTFSSSSSSSNTDVSSAPPLKQLNLTFKDLELAHLQFILKGNNYQTVFDNNNLYNQLTTIERNLIQNAQNYRPPNYYDIPGTGDSFVFGISHSEVCYPSSRTVSGKLFPPNCVTHTFHGRGTLQPQQATPDFSTMSSTLKFKK